MWVLLNFDGHSDILHGTDFALFHRIQNTKREDIVFIAFNFWVLGMSIVALLNESIPHIFASLLTHVMSTAWAVFQITHTAGFRSTFDRIITQGACASAPPILPAFWRQRAMAEFPSLAMHVVSLFISSFLTWKLVKVRTITRVVMQTSSYSFNSPCSSMGGKRSKESEQISRSTVSTKPFSPCPSPSSSLYSSWS